jgi:4-hydroxy-2-oxoglutarate aldolase
MSTPLKGVFSAITTPFDPSTGDVAPVPLRANARALLDAGLDGILAAGSTGEAALLSDDEYRQVVGWLRDVVPADKWLIVGSGKESTRATIKASKVAADEGADAVLVRPPAYYGSTLSAAALVAHFRRVADESSLPVFIYNIPKFTHVALSDQVLASLTDHPNIVGAKDSSGDLKNFANYRAAVPSWALFVGGAGLLYAALEIGARGGIMAAANYCTPLCVSLCQAFARGDRGQAGAIQETLIPLHRDIVAALGVPGIKAAMEGVGLHGGPVRAPLQDLPTRDRERVTGILRTAGLAADPVGGNVRA